MKNQSELHFDDFTEFHYRSLLRLAKEKWEFISFRDYKKEGKKILWRHDVDFSVHRAVKLAKIEAEEGVKSTCFIHIHNIFYNILEKNIMELIFRIRDFGHDLGIHFDPDFYQEISKDDDWTEWLIYEKNIFEKNFRTTVEAFSWHNPELGNWLRIDTDEIGGMINVYGSYLRENYEYCSDSNGYWRFNRLKDVLETGNSENLHILTHPGWWTPESMSPNERVNRCIEGRAVNTNKLYDEFLQNAKRRNIRYI